MQETKAEAVVFVVCQPVGLDTNSASSDYISLYQGDKKTLAASLGRIQQTAARIIEGVLAQKKLLPAMMAGTALVMKEAA